MQKKAHRMKKMKVNNPIRIIIPIVDTLDPEDQCSTEYFNQTPHLRKVEQDTEGF